MFVQLVFIFILPLKPCHVTFNKSCTNFIVSIIIVVANDNDNIN